MIYHGNATLVREFEICGIKHVELKAVEHDTPVMMYKSEHELMLLLEQHGIAKEAMELVAQYGSDRVQEDGIC